jgi:hypothetical protein
LFGVVYTTPGVMHLYGMEAIAAGVVFNIPGVVYEYIGA